jgi:hypothetical protein
MQCEWLHVEATGTQMEIAVAREKKKGMSMLRK